MNPPTPPSSNDLDAPREYGLISIPRYLAWSERKLAEGEPERFIGHLDTMSMLLTPSELDQVDDAVFEEWLAELKYM